MVRVPGESLGTTKTGRSSLASDRKTSKMNQNPSARLQHQRQVDVTGTDGLRFTSTSP